MPLNTSTSVSAPKVGFTRARKTLPRIAIALLLASAGAASGTEIDAALTDCDAATHARVLRPSGQAPLARAYWLDRRHLLWPGEPATGRYRLHHAEAGGLDLLPGQRPAPGHDVFPLAVQGDRVPKALAARFPHLGEGVLLRLDLDDPSLDRLLRGELQLVREDEAGHVTALTRAQIAGVLDDLHAPAATGPALGATVEQGNTSLRVWAPTARNVRACLHEGAATAAASVVAMHRDDASGVWSARLDPTSDAQYYTYLVDVFVPGTGLVRNRVTDPYSLSLSADSRRTYIADMDRDVLKPEGWDKAVRPAALAAATDMAVYELHVRDFSRDDASVPAAHRGRYLAFGKGDSDGMRHLRALGAAGISDVHLLPVFDLATVPERDCIQPTIADAAADSDEQQAAVMAVATGDCFNWGYDPFHYTAPEGSYSSNADDGATRIREFRAMVQALHAAGLRVGMDVVYNHTSASGQDPRSVLDRIVPGYYHRLDADGGVERSTCCDNTATEHRMMERLMVDSAVAWVKHYRIDSFRFDLMGHQPRAAMERLQVAVDVAAGRHVPLIGEGWNFGEVADGKRFVQASQGSLQGSGIGTFSDRGRDAIRGGGPADHGEALRAPGFVNGIIEAGSPGAAKQAADLVRTGLAGTLRDYRMIAADGADKPLSAIDYKGQPAGYAAQPGEVVNYVENHDNQTLFDINAIKLPAATTPVERARVQVLALALNAFSQGIAYFHAGGELMRSKSLDRNSFDSGDWFNRIDWSGQDNHFGTGLPPAADNGEDWPLMRPLLRDARLLPAPEDIAFVRGAFLDLLRIRQSTTLLRLRDAAAVTRRLRFLNTGPEQDPSIIAGHLDGRGYPGARFDELLYVVNVAASPRSLLLAGEAGKPYVLHPVQVEGSDPRVREARFDAASGRFELPARTAVVFVVEAP